MFLLTKKLISLNVDELPIKMHTANTFLNALYIAKKHTNLPLLVHSRSGNAEQWLGIEIMPNGQRRELTGIRDMNLAELIRRVQRVGDDYRDIYTELVTFLNLEPSRHCTIALLHYIYKTHLAPTSARLYEGHDITRFYNPYAFYGIDQRIQRNLIFKYEPYKAIYLVTDIQLRFGPTKETAKATFVKTEPHSDDSMLGSIGQTLRLLREHVKAAPPTGSTNQPNSSIADKHYYPSNEMLDLIFINDNCDNNISLGLTYLLEWSLSQRHVYSLTDWIRRLRGAITAPHRSVDWLGRLTTQIFRSQCELYDQIVDDDCVILLDRVMMCYIKLSLWATLKKNQKSKLVKYRYVILFLLLKMPTLSAKNLLLALSKREHATSDACLSKDYTIILLALSINNQLGGTTEDVRRELHKIYGGSTALCSDSEFRYNDLYLRNRFRDSLGGLMKFEQLVRVMNLDEAEADYLQFDYEALQNQFEFELEDSFSDLVSCLEHADQEIYKHAVRAFARIVGVDDSPSDLNMIAERIEIAELTDVRYKFLRAMLGLKDMDLITFTQSIQQTTSAIQISENATNNLLIDCDKNGLYSTLPQNPVDSLSFMHLIINQNEAVYSFNQSLAATICFATLTS